MAVVAALWMVVGPLAAAAHQPAAGRRGAPRPFQLYLSAVAWLRGVIYGVPVWGCGALGAGLATALTVRAARDRLPFSLTWWSFTLPVGTCVTASTGLALHTGSAAFRAAAVALYLVLVTAWIVVGVRTVRGGWRSELFRPPAAPAAPRMG